MEIAPRRKGVDLHNQLDRSAFDRWGGPLIVDDLIEVEILGIQIEAGGRAAVEVDASVKGINEVGHAGAPRIARIAVVALEDHVVNGAAEPLRLNAAVEGNRGDGANLAALIGSAEVLAGRLAGDGTRMADVIGHRAGVEPTGAEKTEGDQNEGSADSTQGSHHGRTHR